MLDQQSFIDHLEALRRTILGNLAVMAVLLLPAALLVHWGMPQILKLFSGRVPGCTFYYLTPLEPFFLELKLTLAAAFLAGLPLHLMLWGKFLAPALYRSEKRIVLSFGGAALVLFFSGAALAVLGVLPLLLSFSAGFATAEWQPMLTLSSVISLALMLALGFGLAFELPIAVLLAVRGGLIRVETLKKKRPAILVLILTLSAILTPPDVLSQCLMAIPAYLLFEISLFIAGRWEPKAEAEMPEENEPAPAEEVPGPEEEPEEAPEPESAFAPQEYVPPTAYDRSRRGIRRGRPHRRHFR